MTSRIDPIRRAALIRKAVKAAPEATEQTTEAEVVRLPVPVNRVSPAPRPDEQEGHAAFAAQLIGQDGQKRGLRGGPELMGAAKTSYNRVEWSGAKDRRAPKGAKAKTEI